MPNTIKNSSSENPQTKYSPFHTFVLLFVFCFISLMIFVIAFSQLKPSNRPSIDVSEIQKLRESSKTNPTPQDSQTTQIQHVRQNPQNS